MCCDRPPPRVATEAVKCLRTGINLRELHHSVLGVRAPGLHPARKRYRPVLNLVSEAGMLVISGARGRDIRRCRCGR